jgi:hypothetical protein
MQDIPKYKTTVSDIIDVILNLQIILKFKYYGYCVVIDILSNTLCVRQDRT